MKESRPNSAGLISYLTNKALLPNEKESCPFTPLTPTHPHTPHTSHTSHTDTLAAHFETFKGEKAAEVISVETSPLPFDPVSVAFCVSWDGWLGTSVGSITCITMTSPRHLVIGTDQGRVLLFKLGGNKLAPEMDSDQIKAYFLNSLWMIFKPPFDRVDAVTSVALIPKAMNDASISGDCLNNEQQYVLLTGYQSGCILIMKLSLADPMSSSPHIVLDEDRSNNFGPTADPLRNAVEAAGKLRRAAQDILSSHFWSSFSSQTDHRTAVTEGSNPSRLGRSSRESVPIGNRSDALLLGENMHSQPSSGAYHLGDSSAEEVLWQSSNHPFMRSKRLGVIDQLHCHPIVGFQCLPSCVGLSSDGTVTVMALDANGSLSSVEIDILNHTQWTSNDPHTYSHTPASGLPPADGTGIIDHHYFSGQLQKGITASRGLKPKSIRTSASSSALNRASVFCVLPLDPIRKQEQGWIDYIVLVCPFRGGLELIPSTNIGIKDGTSSQGFYSFLDDYIKQPEESVNYTVTKHDNMTVFDIEELHWHRMANISTSLSAVPPPIASNTNNNDHTNIAACFISVGDISYLLVSRNKKLIVISICPSYQCGSIEVYLQSVFNLEYSIESLTQISKDCVFGTISDTHSKRFILINGEEQPSLKFTIIDSDLLPPNMDRRSDKTIVVTEDFNSRQLFRTRALGSKREDELNGLYGSAWDKDTNSLLILRFAGWSSALAELTTPDTGTNHNGMSNNESNNPDPQGNDQSVMMLPPHHQSCKRPLPHDKLVLGTNWLLGLCNGVVPSLSYKPTSDLLNTILEHWLTNLELFFQENLSSNCSMDLYELLLSASPTGSRPETARVRVCANEESPSHCDESGCEDSNKSVSGDVTPPLSSLRSKDTSYLRSSSAVKSSESLAQLLDNNDGYSAVPTIEPDKRALLGEMYRLTSSLIQTMVECRMVQSISQCFLRLTNRGRLIESLLVRTLEPYIFKSAKQFSEDPNSKSDIVENLPTLFLTSFLRIYYNRLDRILNETDDGTRCQICRLEDAQECALTINSRCCGSCGRRFVILIVEVCRCNKNLADLITSPSLIKSILGLPPIISSLVITPLFKASLGCSRERQLAEETRQTPPTVTSDRGLRQAIDFLLYQSSQFRLYLIGQYIKPVSGVSTCVDENWFNAWRNIENSSSCCPTINLMVWTYSSTVIERLYEMEVEGKLAPLEGIGETNQDAAVMMYQPHAFIQLFNTIHSIIIQRESSSDYSLLVDILFRKDDANSSGDGGNYDGNLAVPPVLRALLSISPKLTFECCLIPLLQTIKVYGHNSGGHANSVAGQNVMNPMIVEKITSCTSNQSIVNGDTNTGGRTGNLDLSAGGGDSHYLKDGPTSAQSLFNSLCAFISRLTHEMTLKRSLLFKECQPIVLLSPAFRESSISGVDGPEMDFNRAGDHESRINSLIMDVCFLHLWHFTLSTIGAGEGIISLALSQLDSIVEFILNDIYEDTMGSSMDPSITEDGESLGKSLNRTQQCLTPSYIYKVKDLDELVKLEKELSHSLFIDSIVEDSWSKEGALLRILDQVIQQNETELIYHNLFTTSTRPIAIKCLSSVDQARETASRAEKRGMIIAAAYLYDFIGDVDKTLETYLRLTVTSPVRFPAYVTKNRLAISYIERVVLSFRTSITLNHNVPMGGSSQIGIAASNRTVSRLARSDMNEGMGMDVLPRRRYSGKELVRLKDHIWNQLSETLTCLLKENDRQLYVFFDLIEMLYLTCIMADDQMVEYKGSQTSVMPPPPHSDRDYKLDKEQSTISQFYVQLEAIVLELLEVYPDCAVSMLELLAHGRTSETSNIHSGSCNQVVSGGVINLNDWIFPRSGLWKVCSIRLVRKHFRLFVELSQRRISKSATSTSGTTESGCSSGGVAAQSSGWTRNTAWLIRLILVDTRDLGVHFNQCRDLSTGDELTDATLQIAFHLLCHEFEPMSQSISQLIVNGLERIILDDGVTSISLQTDREIVSEIQRIWPISSEKTVKYISDLYGSFTKETQLQLHRGRQVVLRVMTILIGALEFSKPYPNIGLNFSSELFMAVLLAVDRWLLQLDKASVLRPILQAHQKNMIIKFINMIHDIILEYHPIGKRRSINIQISPKCSFKSRLLHKLHLILIRKSISELSSRQTLLRNINAKRHNNESSRHINGSHKDHLIPGEHSTTPLVFDFSPTSPRAADPSATLPVHTHSHLIRLADASCQICGWKLSLQNPQQDTLNDSMQQNWSEKVLKDALGISKRNEVLKALSDTTMSRSGSLLWHTQCKLARP